MLLCAACHPGVHLAMTLRANSNSFPLARLGPAPGRPQLEAKMCQPVRSVGKAEHGVRVVVLGFLGESAVRHAVRPPIDRAEFGSYSRILD